MVKIYGENQIIDSNGDLLPFTDTSVNSIESVGINDNFNLKTFQRVYENYFQLIKDNYKALELAVKTNLNSKEGIIKEYSSATLTSSADGFRVVLPFVAYLNGSLIVNEPNVFLAARQLEYKLGLDVEFSEAKIIITYSNNLFSMIVKAANGTTEWASSTYDRGYKLINAFKTQYSLTFNTQDILLEPTFLNTVANIKIDEDGNIVEGVATTGTELQIIDDNKILAFNEKIELGNGCTYKASVNYDGTVLSFGLAGTGSQYVSFNQNACFSANVCSASACITGLVKAGCIDAGSCVGAITGKFTNVMNSGCIQTGSLCISGNTKALTVEATSRVCTPTVCSTNICNTGSVCSLNVIATNSCFGTACPTNICSTNIRGTTLYIQNINGTGTFCLANLCNSGDVRSATLNVSGTGTIATLNSTTGNIVTINSTTINNTGNLTSCGNVFGCSNLKIQNFICSTNLEYSGTGAGGSLTLSNTLNGVCSYFTGLSCSNRLQSNCFALGTGTITTGTLTTLNATTGTISTLNSTTGNIITVNSTTINNSGVLTNTGNIIGNSNLKISNTICSVGLQYTGAGTGCSLNLTGDFIAGSSTLSCLTVNGLTALGGNTSVSAILSANEIKSVTGTAKITSCNFVGSNFEIYNGITLNASLNCVGDLSVKNAIICGNLNVSGNINSAGTLTYSTAGFTNISACTGNITTISSTTINNSGTLTNYGILNGCSNAFIAGSVYAGAFRVNSLKSLKENINSFEESGLEKINQLNIVTFNYKNDKNKEKKVGIIADYSPEIFTGMYKDGFDVPNATAVLIKAVQELTFKIERMEKCLQLA